MVSMIPRIIAATIGGGLITTAMLLGMNQFTERFKEQDPIRYFTITDFIAAPPGRRPTPPPAPAAPPDRPQIEYRQPVGTRLPVESPAVEADRLQPPPLVPESRREPEPAR
jgi:hypothetical protein